MDTKDLVEALTIDLDLERRRVEELRARVTGLSRALVVLGEASLALLECSSEPCDECQQIGAFCEQHQVEMLDVYAKLEDATIAAALAMPVEAFGLAQCAKLEKAAARWRQQAGAPEPPSGA